jgi:hypothetical protein
LPVGHEAMDCCVPFLVDIHLCLRRHVVPYTPHHMEYPEQVRLYHSSCCICYPHYILDIDGEGRTKKVTRLHSVKTWLVHSKSIYFRKIVRMYIVDLAMQRQYGTGLFYCYRSYQKNRHALVRNNICKMDSFFQPEPDCFIRKSFKTFL